MGEYIKKSKSIPFISSKIDGLKPNNAQTYLGLGITYWRMNEAGLAKAAWARSMEIDPTNNDARGWLLLAGKTSS